MKRGRVGRRLLLVLASTFVVSAWLVCLATMHTMRLANDTQDVTAASALIDFFRDYGAIVLAIELVALAICAAGMVLAERRSPGHEYDSTAERVRNTAGSPGAERQPTVKDEENRYDDDAGGAMVDGHIPPRKPTTHIRNRGR